MYIRDILEKFGMNGCKPVFIPMISNQKLTKSSNTKSNSDYQKIIGALMYLAVCTRPDICHAVSYFSKFNQYNDKEHCSSA